MSAAGLVRRIQLLEEDHRIEPAGIVDVGHLGPGIVPIPEHCRPEGPDRRHVGSVDADLDEAHRNRIRRQSEITSRSLDLPGEFHEPRVGPGCALPAVLGTVDHDTVGPQVDQQPEPGVIGQVGHRGDQLDRLPGRGRAVEGHRAEGGRPITGRLLGCQLPARTEIDLVAVDIGESDLPGSGRLLTDRRPCRLDRVR